VALTLKMAVAIVRRMEVGNIVEYIDRQKIVCAVVIAVKNQRLRLLSEANREVNLSAKRLLHFDSTRLDLSAGRDRAVVSLKELANRRNEMIGRIDVQELWQVLKSEREWIDLETMTTFCFPDEPGPDQQSAVVRALFEDRLYFKFSPGRFLPNSEEQVARLAAQRKEEERRARLISRGRQWLSRLRNGNQPMPPADVSEDIVEVARILRSYFLFGRESDEYKVARAILTRGRNATGISLFETLVKAGVFDADENLDLLRFGIQTDFPPEIHRQAAALIGTHPEDSFDGRRRDLTHLHLMTIDGQATLDFDDAISIEIAPDRYTLGVHIADVGHVVSKDGLLDRDARSRTSSIYMPDQKISMLPPVLAEGLCSLRAGALRPAISTLIDLSTDFEILNVDIVPSVVRVNDQLTYYDVNVSATTDPKLTVLLAFAQAFRRQRLEQGAVQINLPEISIWLNDDKAVFLSQVNRESPGRLLVTEIMILTNWLMARHLAELSLPTVFRSQPKPRLRLYEKDEGTLFQHWMQRRHLSRFVLGSVPEKHEGLGLDMYTTGTSPIRKYVDLVTQRQVRAGLGLEVPYSMEEIDTLVQELEVPMSQVARVQYLRHRYWLLKYLQNQVGQKLEATVLMKRRMSVQVLLNDYMIECDMPAPPGMDLNPEDLIQVTLQKVNVRNDEIILSLG
jgi:exoribonuclease-2